MNDVYVICSADVPNILNDKQLKRLKLLKAVLTAHFDGVIYLAVNKVAPSSSIIKFNRRFLV